MNNKIKFLEIVLSDLVSERDTLELDLNNVVNTSYEKTNDKKKKFVTILENIVKVNNKIKILTEYLTELSTTSDEMMVSNNKK